MFDISWGELVLIGVVALIVIGPKELPTVLRTLGQGLAKVRRMASEFQGQFQEALREAEFSDLKKQVDAIGEGTNFNPLDSVKRDFESLLDDKPKDDTSTDTAAGTPAIETSASTTSAGTPAAADAPPVPPTADPVIPHLDIPPPDPAPPPAASDFNPDRPADPAAATDAPLAPPPPEGGRTA